MRSVLHTDTLGDIPLVQLRDLAGSLQAQASTKYEVWYVEQLERSITSLQEKKEREKMSIRVDSEELEQVVSEYHASC